MDRAQTALICMVLLVLSFQVQGRGLLGNSFLLPMLYPQPLPVPATGPQPTPDASGGSATIATSNSTVTAAAVQTAAQTQTMATAKPNPMPVSRAAPPTAPGAQTVAGGAWQVTGTTINFNPLSNVRVLSPLCGTNREATSCVAFSGNTAVVVSSVMAAVGTSTNVKTTQCFCDFRNTVNGFLPATGAEIYRCGAYCQ